MKWDSKLYDNAQGFVSEFGKELMSYIPQRENQIILDLGCGTGDLTNEIDKRALGKVIGCDYSKEMIEQARMKYPNLEFVVQDACQLAYSNEYDVVFSNAVFHWILEQNLLHKSIYNALKSNGILICEFGGYQNIEKISRAFGEALAIQGDVYKTPFYFPNVEQHTSVLKKAKFHIDKIYDFDRPTVLPNGSLGLRQWLRQFFSSDLKKYNEDETNEILENVEDNLKENIFDGEKWIADYRRIRVVAHK